MSASEYKLPVAKSIEEIRAEEEKAAQEAAKAAKEAEAKERAEAEKKAANSSDVAVLAALVQLEAGGESYEGKLAVASVVMNRVRSGGYPNSVSGVVYQSGQFPPAGTARMASLVANGAGSDCVKAAKQAIGGVSNIGSLKHFHAARLGGDVVIGNHAFLLKKYLGEDRRGAGRHFPAGASFWLGTCERISLTAR